MDEPQNVDQSATTTGKNPSRSHGVWWRLPLLLAVVLVAVVAARSVQQRGRGPALENATAHPPAEPTGKFVSLVVRFDAGRERSFDAIAWHPGMTVDDLMTAASRLADGITYQVVGNGETTMLVGIEGTIQHRGGGSYWTYQVNEVLADRSLAVYELQPGDRVLWTFGQSE